ncbi:MAG: DUF3301 domain-containing protein [Sulfuritalea sp.]|nr:DUF3301 domain-containing protein [Thiobacillus sp.]MDP1980937.1 DUF3301 domain-containing protein [Sulfuritalea sp.]
MPVFEILSLAALGALAWLWYDSLQVRGIGIGAAKSACAAEDLQLLDDTVSISSLGLGRDDNGRLLLRRVYGFDYSDNGDNRRSGSVVMLGQRVLVVNVGLRLVASNPTLH